MEQTITPTEPENAEQAFDAPGIEQPREATTPDGANPLEDFFRVNGMEQDEPTEDPFAEVALQPSLEQPAQEAVTQPDNDEKRYQYWQSEADKARNEKQQLEGRLLALESQQASQPQAVQQTQQEPEPDNYFPPPPSKPEKPKSFSREDAYADTSSDSAQYLDEVDGWRDDMDDYNRLHNEFNTALVEEERQKINTERDNIMRAEADKVQYQEQMGDIANHLRTNYNASEQEVAQFVEVMDKPESVTVDNLFQLYRLQSGNQVQQQVPTSKPITETAKNDSFEQMKRAQQVPTTMGVLPATGNTGGSSEDSMMDSMVSALNDRNPW